MSYNTQKYLEVQATQATGTNLHWSNYEIHELLQLHKMSKGSDSAVYIRVATSIDEYTWNMAEIYNKFPRIEEWAPIQNFYPI